MLSVRTVFSSFMVICGLALITAHSNPVKLGPPSTYGPNNKFGDIDAIGYILGKEIEKVARSIETFPGGSIEAVHMTVEAAGKKRLESRAPNQKLEANENVAIHLAAQKIGNLLFAGVSGELMTEIGMRIKAESPYTNTIVVTHCNGNT